MTAPVVELRGLSRRFGAVEAARAVTLDLRPGEIHALIGPNGAGKSTLIGLTAGSLRPDAGSVLLGGEDVTRLDAVGRARKGLGRTFQVSSLAMELTVLENALLGAVGRSGQVMRLFRSALCDRDLALLARAALERVGLVEEADRRTADLSHGQRRLLEVAVALTLEPRAFLMDEPMAGLGAEGSRRLTGFLDRLREEAPILLVEHDMDAVFAIADRISVLCYGEIIATGTAEDIRRDPRVRIAYLGDDAA
ncbi:ABC transporter ATP-binding protein [Rubellimicrobium roseum]|uniref:ABC transporter ATP-binding protein n=1 Tax=Rubellimicrobium roseum TaxID=687525 RepID=A0A5C4N9N7_9RHOB|nr:ABC transporter ATP-binding protein [Rubellimicrobium roseum]TNC60698.1 ABC transporter ATP-binding protein [Rubellimicrobium roseum]